MLTGDENIVDLNFTVFWIINDAKDFLFNVRNPVATIKSIGESVMREKIGQTPIGPILSEILETNERLICKNNITYVLVGNLVYRKTEDGSLLLMIPENQAKIFLEYIHVHMVVI